MYKVPRYGAGCGEKKGLESWIGLCQFTAVMIIWQGTRT